MISLLLRKFAVVALSAVLLGTAGAATVSTDSGSVVSTSHSRKDALYYIGAEAGESIPPNWTTGVDVVYDDHASPPPVGLPPQDDLISGTLQLDFNANFSNRWGRIDADLANRLFRILNQNNKDGRILRAIFGQFSDFDGPDEWQTICDCRVANTLTDPALLSIVPVPEPTSVLLLTVGLGAFALRRQRD